LTVGGAWVGALLAARLLVTATGVAAGIALYRQQPGAVRLARIALVLSTGEALAGLSSGYALSTAPPGTHGPRAILIVGYTAAWLAYLHNSKRVRAAFD
jgi:hypothetical protein